MRKTLCPSCSAELDIDLISDVFSCDYCGISLFFNLNGLNLSYCYHSKINELEAKKNFRNFALKKNISSDYKIVNINFYYIPFWYDKEIKKLHRAYSLFPQESINSLSLPLHNIDSKKISGNDKKDVDILMPKGEKKYSLLYVPFFIFDIKIDEENHIFFVGAAKQDIFTKFNRSKFNKDKKYLSNIFFLSILLFSFINYLPLKGIMSVALNLGLIFILFSFVSNYLKD